jgi:excinuclease ABC subunit A
MESIIPDHSKSIKEGGIAPLGERRDAHVFKTVEAIAKKKISLDKPIKDLPAASLNMILYGNAEGPGLDVLEVDEDLIPGEVHTRENMKESSQC